LGQESYIKYLDDPSVTAIEKVRQDACVTFTGDVKVEGEIGKSIIPAGKHAVLFLTFLSFFEKAVVNQIDNKKGASADQEIGELFAVLVNDRGVAMGDIAENS